MVTTQLPEESAFGAPPPSPAGPTGGKTPFLEIWKNVLTSPSVATFARYRYEADLGRAVIWLLAVSLIAAILSIPAQLFNPEGINRAAEMLGSNLGPQVDYDPGQMIFGLVCGALLAPIVSVIFSFIWVGLLYVIAKLFQGEGTFTETFFLYAAVAAPLGVISAVVGLVSGVLGIIPTIGPILSGLFVLVGLALALYGLFLQMLAVAAANEFSVGKGVAVVLIPLAILLLICCCLVFGLFAMIGSILQGQSFNY